LYQASNFGGFSATQNKEQDMIKKINK